GSSVSIWAECISDPCSDPHMWCARWSATRMPRTRSTPAGEHTCATMSMKRIPFNRPYVTGDEVGLMSDAMARGHLSGDGHYTAEASRLLREITGSANVLLTTSCTHALEMSAFLLD